MIDISPDWREQAAVYARRMSQVKWSPVADGIPMLGGGTFQRGTEYTGLPYSSVKSAGKFIGFDVSLKTFLAAVQNPVSVLYTEDLSGEMVGAACCYGKVCSTLTSYAFQLGTQNECCQHVPPRRRGIVPVEPQSAQAAEVGDIIYRASAPEQPTAHVEIITEVIRNRAGKVTYVRVDEAVRPMTRQIYRRSKDFNDYLTSGRRVLHRIVDLDGWREENRAESFLFPNYRDDAADPSINRVLLLDRGDWAVYEKDQPVKFNIMDKDAVGVNALIVKRGDTAIEEISLRGAGVVERTFSVCGDYTAYCRLQDGSESRACEFAVCNLDFTVAFTDKVRVIEFAAANTEVRIVRLIGGMGGSAKYRHNLFVTAQDRQNGRMQMPTGIVETPGTWQVLLLGENRYGRLKKRRDIVL